VCGSRGVVSYSLSVRRRSVRTLAAALGLAGLLTASGSAAAQDTANGVGPRGTLPAALSAGPGSPPRGLIAVQQWLSNQPNQPFAFRSEVYANSSIDGVLFRANWSSVEPSEGQFNWQIIDDMFAAAAANGKFVTLSFVPGFATPAWALPGVATATFDWQYGPKGEAGQPGTLPMPWDPTYLSRWFAFLQEVANRYANNPQFRMISVAGPTSVSEETSLPHNAQDPGLPNGGSDLAQWISLGYTPARYEAAWKTVLQEYAQLFSGQYLSVATARVLNIGNKGTRDPTQEDATLRSVIGEGLNYPDRFVLQDNGLTASSTAIQAQDRTVLFDLVGSYSGTVITGFQVGTAATINPGPQGDATSPVNALGLSLGTGLAEHPDFLEVWEQDVVNPDMQDVLQATEAQLLNSPDQ
jgi:Beta-galactosidase